MQGQEDIRAGGCKDERTQGLDDARVGGRKGRMQGWEGIRGMRCLLKG